MRGLAERTMFPSISFDPARDRPARLARYAQAVDADPARWLPHSALRERDPAGC
jgi:cytochrome oxidase Cu insertion factor (SCO1/SenC/PrrC family)